jgi:hypothetical protein
MSDHPRSTRCSGIRAFGALALMASAACVAHGEDGESTGAASSDLTNAYSLFAATDAPKSASDSDASAVEVGVRFHADKDGVISALRFYKGSGNTGTHVGHVWSSSGALLATQTFRSESGSGWQSVALANPVAIKAGQTCVASYHTSTGHYAGDNGYFTGHAVDNGPLHAPADTSAGHNGVYHYGASAFPTSSWKGSNYWVDVVYSPTTAPTDAGAPPPADAGGSPVDAGPPASGTSCAAKPSACGFPDATNTGVPPGTVLRRVPEDITAPTRPPAEAGTGRTDTSASTRRTRSSRT